MSIKKKKAYSGPLYRKVSPKFWRDEKVRSLDPIDKLIAVYAFTGQANRIGLFTFSPGMAIEDLGLTEGTLGGTLGVTLAVTFRERFRHVCRTLGWGWDESVGVLFLPTWWKYNPPDNENVLIGNLSDLDQVPQTTLLKEFCVNLTHLKVVLHVTFTETLAKRYPQHLPQRIPPEAEAKADTEAETGARSECDGETPPNTLITTKKKQTPKFVPPTIDEVRAYCRERSNAVDPNQFVDYYTANGWHVGKQRMKDWKASVRYWERNERLASSASNSRVNGRGPLGSGALEAYHQLQGTQHGD